MNEELILAIEQLRRRPTDRIWFVPVLLNECAVPDREIGAGETLRDLQWVDLSNNWERGVASVLQLIVGADFLDRRSGRERRQRSLLARLRVGLWKRYHEATGIGKFEAINAIGRHGIEKMIQALEPEARRYSYSDRHGEKIDYSSVLRESVRRATAHLDPFSDRDAQAIYVIEDIAGHIFADYSVKAVERRRAEEGLVPAKKATIEARSQTPKFRCGKCEHEALVSQAMIVAHGAEAYLRCPECGYEENDRDYSARRTLELSFES